LQKTIASKKNNKHAERLVIGAITGKGSETRIMMDTIKPASSLLVSPMKIRKQKHEFSRCVKQTQSVLTGKPESYRKSAILETVKYVAYLIHQTQAKKKRLIVFSDMIQNSEALSFYKLKKLDIATLIKQVIKEKLVSALTGIDVFVVGAGGNLSDQQARRIEEFWRQLFLTGHGNLKTYGPLLTGF